MDVEEQPWKLKEKKKARIYLVRFIKYLRSGGSCRTDVEHSMPKRMLHSPRRE